jgi:hypothetical protein
VVGHVDIWKMRCLRILIEEREGKYHLMYDVKDDLKDRVTANAKFCLLGCGAK